MLQKSLSRMPLWLKRIKSSLVIHSWTARECSLDTPWKHTWQCSPPDSNVVVHVWTWFLATPETSMSPLSHFLSRFNVFAKMSRTEQAFQPTKGTRIIDLILHMCMLRSAQTACGIWWEEPIMWHAAYICILYVILMTYNLFLLLNFDSMTQSGLYKQLNKVSILTWLFVLGEHWVPISSRSNTPMYSMRVAKVLIPLMLLVYGDQIKAWNCKEVGHMISGLKTLTVVKRGFLLKRQFASGLLGRPNLFARTLPIRWFLHSDQNIHSRIRFASGKCQQMERDSPAAVSAWSNSSSIGESIFSGWMSLVRVVRILQAGSSGLLADAAQKLTELSWEEVPRCDKLQKHMICSIIRLIQFKVCKPGLLRKSEGKSLASDSCVLSTLWDVVRVSDFVSCSVGSRAVLPASWSSWETLSSYQCWLREELSSTATVSVSRTNFQVHGAFFQSFSYAFFSSRIPVVPHKAVAEVSRIGNYRRDWLLWVTDGRAKTLMDRTVQLCNWLTDYLTDCRTD